MKITSTDWMLCVHIYLAAGLAAGNQILVGVAFGFLAITVRAYLLETSGGG